MFGKPGKAGKQATPHEVAGNPSGPQSGSNEIPDGPFRYGRNPVALSYSRRLFYATSLISPMVRGRFRPQDQGGPQRSGNGRPDLGRLQGFRGSFAGPKTVRLGAQSGPSSQPGFPSTNNDQSVDFSGMGLPDVWRVNTL